MGAWILLALLITADLSADQGILAAVHVRIDQDGRLSSAELQTIVGEIAGIWAAAGVRVTSGRFSEPVPPRSAIVSMRIVSVVEGAHDTGQMVLGWVTGDLIEPLTPTIFISQSGVRALLARSTYKGLPFDACPSALRGRLAARAMGRVAAHELGHYFLGGRHHHARGLMRSSYKTTDLLSESLKRFEIRPEQRVSLRHEVAKRNAGQ